jgi:hypothetical protein
LIGQPSSSSSSSFFRRRYYSIDWFRELVSLYPLWFFVCLFVCVPGLGLGLGRGGILFSPFFLHIYVTNMRGGMGDQEGDGAGEERLIEEEDSFGFGKEGEPEAI